MNRFRGGFEHHGLILLVTAQVANCSGLLFHMLLGGDWVSWGLEADEYQTMVFMINTVLIATAPMDAFRSMAGHYASLLIRENRAGDIRRFWRFWSFRLSLAAVGILGVGALLAVPVSLLFHVNQPGTWMLSMAALGLTLQMFHLAGIFQGMQCFYWMAAVQNVWSFLKVILAVLMVYTFAPLALFGVAAHGLGMGCSVLIGLVGLYWVTRDSPAGAQPVPHASGYLVRSMILMTGFTALLNMDIHVVQFFLPSTDALAAKGGTIARAVVFLPMPIALALFPKVTSARQLRREDATLLWKALRYVLILVAAIGGICALKPEWPLWALYGELDPSPLLRQTVRGYVLAMMPLAVCHVLLNFFIAQRRFRACGWILVSAVLFLGSSALFHSRVLDVVVALGFSALFGLVMMLHELRRLFRGGFTEPVEAVAEANLPTAGEPHL